MHEKLGEFLLRMDAIKPSQIDDVLSAQDAGDLRLFGEIAIDLGYINDEVLRKYVEAKAAWEKEI